MDVYEAINERRAYRSLTPVDITDETVKDLARNAQLAPSCYNNQPWNFIFVRDENILSKIFESMSSANQWTRNASMVIAVFNKEDDDCRVEGRKYHQFDTGISVGLLILRATEIGLVAHPLAGYKENEVKKILDIPEEFSVITLIIVGKHDDEADELLTEKQIKKEKDRPKRDSLDEFVYLNRYGYYFN